MRITNRMIKRYLELKEKMKIANQEAEQLRDVFLKVGDTKTSDYILKINEKTRDCLAKVEEFEKIFTREELEEKNLVKTIEYKTVDITSA